MGGKVVVKDGPWRKLLARAYGLDKAHVKVGVLADKGGEDEHTEGITMLELAAIHEFGSPAAGVPQRSFIRSTFDQRAAELAETAAKLARLIVTKGMPVRQALGLLGQWGVKEVKATIREQRTTSEFYEPQANRPSTVARKGSDTPLVDTGRLINAVTSQVSEGDE